MDLTHARRLPPLRHAWRDCICIGRAYELLRADLQEHLRYLQREIGYRRIRFHASFHDDVGVYHETPDGKPYYTWTQLDRIYDFLVDAGFDPIVELNPMPKALASGDQAMFWYQMNVTPPKCHDRWGGLVEAFARHAIERYGLHRVRRWMFEVWNEPNLPGFWSGDQADYFELYRSAAQAVKRVDDELAVGGPAGAGRGWNLPLLEYCRQNDVPLDFISSHGYPQNEYIDHVRREGSPWQAGRYLIDEFQSARRELDDAGAEDLPLIVTEWNTQHCGQDGAAHWVGNMDVSSLLSGAAACHYAVNCDPFVDSLGWWTASDVFEESGPHLEPFGGHNQYYGMITMLGSPKPAFHAFRWLSRMQGDRLDLTLPRSVDNLPGALVCTSPSGLRVLAWNFHMPESPDQPVQTTLRLPLPDARRDIQHAYIITATITAGHGSAYETWQEMGRPGTVTRLETEMLHARSQPSYEAHRAPVTDGAVELPVSLGRNDMLFAEIATVPSHTVDGQVAQASQAVETSLQRTPRALAPSVVNHTE